jgi:hypothetical protein
MSLLISDFASQPLFFIVLQRCTAFSKINTLPFYLKVPKCENFDLLFFTLINHIWVGDRRIGIFFVYYEDGG